MNLTQLKYFNAVCTHHTVSEAAETLHISQPSLSFAIKELEGEFGVELFKRRYRGMVLTRAGEALFKMSSDLLARAAEIENTMRDMGNDRKTLRLGIPPMIGSLIIPGIIKGFSQSYPEIQLDITEGGKTELLQKLAEDGLDMLFLPHNRPVEEGYISQQVARYEIVCCVSGDNPIAEKKSVSPKDLDGTPVVLFTNSFFQTGEIKRWFEAGNVTPDILMQTGQLSTVLSLVKSNAAVGFMFRQLIDSNPELVGVATDEPIYADVSLVSKSYGYKTDGMKKFGRFINESSGWVQI